MQQGETMDAIAGCEMVIGLLLGGLAYLRVAVESLRKEVRTERHAHLSTQRELIQAHREHAETAEKQRLILEALMHDRFGAQSLPQ